MSVYYPKRAISNKIQQDFSITTGSICAYCKFILTLWLQSQYRSPTYFLKDPVMDPNA